MKLNENISRVRNLMGLVVEQKKLVATVSGTYTANNCDELHAFQSTGGVVVGNMNVLVGQKLEELYNKSINPEPVRVNVQVDGMTVRWSVDIAESTDGSAWVGFTSRGAGCNNDVMNRAESVSAGNDMVKLRQRVMSTYGESDIELEVVNDFVYRNPENGFRQIFYRYTKPSKFPPKLK